MNIAPFADVAIFKNRRRSLSKAFHGSALILVGNREVLRNRDVHYHPFRQNSSFLYLTGFEEPDAVFVFRPGCQPESVLFVRPRDKTAEMWEGFRFGPKRAATAYKMDACFSVEELDTQLVPLLQEVQSVHYEWHGDAFDAKVVRALREVQQTTGRSGWGLLDVHDPSPIIGEARVQKSAQEISWLKEAACISCEAHRMVQEQVQPGMTEGQLATIFEHTCRMQGVQRMGYPPIVAAGNQATILHYHANDQKIRKGELVLIDAGAEWNYYSADITRTFSADGKWTPAQKALYDAVVYVQEQIISMCRPKVSFASLQEKAVSLLVESLCDLKILKGNRQKLIREKSYKAYYPHGIGHFLGLDVHDTGLVRYPARGSTKAKEEPRPLKAQMVITVEPGLYVPARDTQAPKEFRGIGVRIEDDILITKKGAENLTKMIAK